MVWEFSGIESRISEMTGTSEGIALLMNCGTVLKSVGK